MNTTYFIPQNYNSFISSVNDNIIIYNGELLPEDIRSNVTRSIVNLFNNAKSVCDQIVHRSPHCIWFILTKNLPECFIVLSLKNIYAKATNKEILRNALITYPNILQNNIFYSWVNYNIINDIAGQLVNTTNSLNDTFDLLN